MHEGLRVGGMLCFEPCCLPHAGYVVGLGLERFQELCGPFAELLVAFMQPVSVEEGDHGIDDNQIKAVLAQLFACAGRGGGKAVVLLPVGRGGDAEQLPQLVERGGLHGT